VPLAGGESCALDCQPTESSNMSDSNKGSVVLITGASAGIGQATAKRLSKEGFRVFGTSRHPAMDVVDGYEVLPLEVTSAESVQACVEQVLARTGGRLDVLINNVGTGILGAAEESSAEQVQRLFDINLFGSVRMTNAVLPTMRAQRAGKILFLSSAGGVASVPYAGYYCATKHAIEAYAEALRLEIESFGLSAVIIAPGTVSTAAGDKSLQPDRPLSAYAAAREKTTEQFVKAIRDGMEPSVVADKILEVLQTKHPQARYTVGLQSWGVSLMKAVLPAAVLEAGVRRTMQQPNAS
jgi:NAD(P)-dependent dehydrogenase (short-subunit alcohol dehydrogenase family)